LDPSAFTLLAAGGGGVGLTVTTSVVGGRTVAVLTFTGPDLIAGSLADGNYTFTIRADQGHDAAGRGLEADHAAACFRYFGDSDGARDVDGDDQALFESAFGTAAGDAGYQDYFDFNGDGTIDETDREAFLGRLGTALPP